MPNTLIASKNHPLGGFFLAQCADGSFLAGKSEDTARTFASARAVYDFYHSAAAEGSHTAWNICYHIEDRVEPS